MHTLAEGPLGAPTGPPGDRIVPAALVTHDRALAAPTAVGRGSPPLLASRCAAAGCEPRSHAIHNAPSRLKAAERLLLPSPLLPPPADACRRLPTLPALPLMASSCCLAALSQAGAMAGQGTPLVSVVTDYGEHASTCGYCGTRKSGGAKGRRAGASCSGASGHPAAWQAMLAGCCFPLTASSTRSSRHTKPWESVCATCLPLPGTSACLCSVSHGMMAERLSVEAYQQLLDRWACGSAHVPLSLRRSDGSTNFRGQLPAAWTSSPLCA